MLISKSYLKKLCSAVFSVGIVFCGTEEICARSDDSGNEILLQKIAKRSNQDLLSKKLRQEIEAYREIYDSKRHHSDKNEEVIPAAPENSEEKVKEEPSKAPQAVPSQENKTSETRIKKANPKKK